MSITITPGVDTFYEVIVDRTRSKENVLAELDSWANQAANDAYEEELQEETARSGGDEVINLDFNDFNYVYLCFYLQSIEETLSRLAKEARRRLSDPSMQEIPLSEMGRITEISTFLLRYIWEDRREQFTEQFFESAMLISDRLGAGDLLRSVWDVYQNESSDIWSLGYCVRCLSDQAVRDDVAGQLLDQVESILVSDPETTTLEDITQARQLLESLEQPDSVSIVTQTCSDPLKRRSIDLFVRLINHNYQQIGRIDLELLAQQDSGKRDPYDNQTEFELFKRDVDYALRKCVVGL